MKITLLTVEEAAEILRCHPRPIYRAIKGELDGAPPLPAFRFGRRKFVKREKLAEWVNENYGALMRHSKQAPATLK